MNILSRFGISDDDFCQKVICLYFKSLSEVEGFLDINTGIKNVMKKQFDRAFDSILYNWQGSLFIFFRADEEREFCSIKDIFYRLTYSKDIYSVSQKHNVIEDVNGRVVVYPSSENKIIVINISDFFQQGII